MISSSLAALLESGMLIEMNLQIPWLFAEVRDGSVGT